MRKLLISFCLTLILYLFSCSKKSNGCGFQNDGLVAPLSEQQAVKAYLDSSGITASLDPSGFYYQVVNQGYGTKAGLCSQITVTYKGQLTSQKVFDQQTAYLFTLGSLIDGWRKGLPLIEDGGEIKLYIPPTLGYGSRAISTDTLVIPANSILIFDIKLLNVQ